MSKKLKKYNILATLDQLGVDHRDVVDPNRRKFLIRSIHSSTALSAEMKFSLITGIMTLFAPKKAFSQIIPFAFWKENVPPEPLFTHPYLQQSFEASELWAWGGNAWGKIGDGTTTQRSSPVQIPGLWIQGAGGENQTLLLRADNSLWVTGRNDIGQLGLNNATNYSSPVQLAGDFKTVATGRHISSSIKTDDSLGVWGTNNSGELGQSDLVDQSSPVQVSGDWLDISHSASGNTTGQWFHTVAIKGDGTLWAWGRNNIGALGLGDTNDRSSPVMVSSDKFFKVLANGQSSFALREDYTLWAFGKGTSGDLGQVSVAVNTSSPVQIPGSWTQISHAKWSISAIRTDGTLWAWGWNSDGECGQSHTNSISSPVQISGSWVSVGGGGLGGHFLWVRNDGSLWACGRNDNGPLGVGNTTYYSSPVQVGSEYNWKYTLQTCGSHSLALRGGVSISPVNTTQGTLWGWGPGGLGRLGTGGSTNYSSPIQISGDYWTQISTNHYISMGIRNDGSLWVCGADIDLGIGTIGANYNLVNVPGTWKFISSGGRSAHGIKDDDTLWGWGWGDHGKIGHNSTNGESSPVQISGGGSWKYSANNQFHSMGIKTDGTLWAWGQGSYGKLGQESNVTDFSSPVQIGSDSGWAKVGCGYRFSIALKSDGTLWTWGEGWWGLLAQVTHRNDTSSPVQVSGTWIDFAVDERLCFGIKSDNTLWAWGQGDDGKLGIGNNNHYSSPVQITSYKFKFVDAFFQGGHAIRDDGTLWSWGKNDVAQLGLNNLTDYNTPQQVSTDTDWQVVKGANHTIAIKGVTQGGSGGATLQLPQNLLATPGYLWGSGYGGSGGLAQIDSAAHVSSPVQAAGLWRGVDVGAFHTLAIRDDYTLWSWGFDNYGQLGQVNYVENTSSPIQIEGQWKAFSAGYFHSTAIRENGTLWCWGFGDYGGLAQITNNDNTSSPIQVDGSWVSVDAGNCTTGAIKTDGTLWMWGRNNSGSLGDGTIVYRSSPVQVGSDTNWIVVRLGVYQTIGLKDDYTLWSWGNNDYGQIGDGSTTSHSSPVQVLGSWIQATTACHVSAGIKTDGTLWVWGRNENGALAQQDTAHRSSPIQIPGSWLQVQGIGLYETVNYRSAFKAIRNDGTLWTWGQNYRGMLGDGTIIDRSSPVQIGSDNDWVTLGHSESTFSLNIRFAPAQKSYTLWAWGENVDGHLGQITSNANKSSPVQIPGEWVTVSEGGGFHNLGIREDRTMWAWGWGWYGTLGQITNRSNRSSPVQIDGEWLDCATTAESSFGIKIDGTLWSWGRNNHGQLGHSDTVTRSSPVQIGSEKVWRKLFRGGAYHVGAIRNDGTLFMWGSGSAGRLGDGNNVSRSSPVQVNGSWITVAAGFVDSFGIKSDGTLWAWGSDGYGILGQGTSNNAESSPVQIGSYTWKAVTINMRHVKAIRSDDTMWGWGRNHNGQQGQGYTTPNSFNSPVQLAGRAKSIAASYRTAHHIKLDGTLWGMGRNNNGEIGNNTTTSTSSPVQVGSDNNWVRVHSHYGEFATALKDDVPANSNEMWVWGRNNHGQLGISSTDNYSSPIQIGGGKFWEELSPGPDFTLGIRSDGTLWSWGRNNNGQLGLGTADANSFSSPVQVGSDTNWKYVSASSNEANLAIRTDGTLWGWGQNQQGSLGLGDTNSRSSPVQVGTDTNWAKLGGTGYRNSAAIKSDGTLWTWGQGTHGALGLSNWGHYYTPQQVGALTDWSQVVAGSWFCFAIKTDGTLWSWGRNTHGQLGNGNLTDSNSPAQVGSDTNWKFVSAGFWNAIAVKTDGTVWGTGPDWFGALAGGGYESSPVQIGSNSDWDMAVISQQTGMGIKNDGSLWAWGHSDHGRLGDNATTNRYSPVQVSNDSDWGRLIRTGSSRHIAFKKRGS